MASTAMCFDVSGNSVDCTDPNAVGSDASLYGFTDASASTTNPVATASASPSGGTSLGSFFSNLANIGLNYAKSFTSPSNANLRLQLNPATGKQQYYNPATGQYVGGAVGSSSLFGNVSPILLIFAVILGFLAFGRFKKK